MDISMDISIDISMDINLVEGFEGFLIVVILLHSSITEQIINKAQEVLEKDFKPIIDKRAGRKYGMEVANNLMHNCFLEVIQKKLIRVNN